jgi:hypothetical protein
MVHCESVRLLGISFVSAIAIRTGVVKVTVAPLARQARMKLVAVSAGIVRDRKQLIIGVVIFWPFQSTVGRYGVVDTQGIGRLWSCFKFRRSVDLEE